MKTLLFICFIFGFLNAKGQDRAQMTLDSLMYSYAYQYVLDESGVSEKNVYVLPWTHEINFFAFSDKLSDKTNEKQYIDEYMKDKHVWNDPMYSQLLASTFKYKPKVCKRVFVFSDIFHNMIVVDNVPSKKNMYKEYDFNPKNILGFTESMVYLFVFNDDGSIKFVRKSAMIYD